MILVCAADGFRKMSFFPENELFFIHKKYVINKRSSVWCFSKLARQMCNHLYYNSIENILETLIFVKKKLFAFLNQIIVK